MPARGGEQDEVVLLLTDRTIGIRRVSRSLPMAAHAPRRRGAEVTAITVYRVRSAEDPGSMFGPSNLVVERQLHGVTFTSAPLSRH